MPILAPESLQAFGYSVWVMAQAFPLEPTAF